MAQHHISIDLETWSVVPIGKAGAFRYIDDDSFEILLFAYSVDGSEVECIDLTAGEEIPGWLMSALDDPSYIKHAYNAHFEWAALSKLVGHPLPPEQWRCTMFHGLYAGYPAGLDAIGKAIGLPQDKQKMTVGKSLIRYFCVPCKPTKANGGRTRNLPEHAPEKWELFKEYCRQDVRTEMEIEQSLSTFVVPGWLQREWETDLRINARGAAIDVDLVEGALSINDTTRADLIAEAAEITGLDNPNSVSQLAKWLETETDEEIGSLNKAKVVEMLGSDNPDHVQRVLRIRQMLGKSSTLKYQAFQNYACSDGKVHGMLRFYGANRTGRWAGSGPQLQNLPQTHVLDTDIARELVRTRNIDGIRLLYGNVPDTLSQLIRTALIASPGHIFIDCDFSAIEARVISYLAGQEWRLEVFRTHGKIYEASASQMFGVSIERIKKGNPEYALRQKGKVSELALGYAGGQGALIAMGSSAMGIPEEELPGLVQMWRDSNPMIVKLWRDYGSAAEAVITGRKVFAPVGNVIFAKEFHPGIGKTCMSIQLPSGRKLYYPEPRITTNRWGRPSIAYMGQNQMSKKWCEIESHGGKLTENVVQAFSRDVLAAAIERLEAAGYPVVFHIHDEVVIDIDVAAGKTEKDVAKIMAAPVPWAPGLPLNAEGWMKEYFTKD